MGLKLIFLVPGLAWIPTEADSSNRILSKVIKVAHSASENVSYLLNL